MKRTLMAALSLYAAFICLPMHAEEGTLDDSYGFDDSHGFIGERPGPSGDIAGWEQIRLWQEDLAAREAEIQRAQTAWLPPRTVGPVENLVRDRSTFADYLIAASIPVIANPTYVVDWRLAERRWFAYRPYAYPTAYPAAYAVAPPYWPPNYAVGFYPASPGLTGSPRIAGLRLDRTGRPVPVADIEAVPVQATRPLESDWR